MRRFALLGLVCAVVGCNAVGPPALEAGRLDYNEVIARTWNEQMLRNLVRLRYRDTLFFLEISGVSTQYSATYSLGVGPSFAGDATLDIDAGVGFSEKPTITYAPLQGQEFVTQLLSPLSLEALVLLSQSGWSVERVLAVCAQRMNGLDNAAAASGPMPDYEPEHADFRKAAELMRSVQLAGGLEGRVTQVGDAKRLTLRFVRETSDTNELRRMLGLPADAREVAVVDGWADSEGANLGVQMRSLIGVLHFLSTAVQAPATHEDAGWVTRTVGVDGEAFDWGDVVGDLLAIRSSSGRPADAFVSTRYRGTWFYIDNADLNSKSTFGLLTYLFYLQAGEIKSSGPTLTLPVGQ